MCYEHKALRSCNSTVYLSWFLYLEDVLGGKGHTRWVHTYAHENGGSRNVKKHRLGINGKKYITLDIYLKFCSLKKMKITSLEQNNYLEKSGNLLITTLGFNTIG